MYCVNFVESKITLLESSGENNWSLLPSSLLDELSVNKRDREGFYSRNLVGRSSDRSYNLTDSSLNILMRLGTRLFMRSEYKWPHKYHSILRGTIKYYTCIASWANYDYIMLTMWHAWCHAQFHNYSPSPNLKLCSQRNRWGNDDEIYEVILSKSYSVQETFLEHENLS